MSLIDCKVELGLSVTGYSVGNFVLDSNLQGILGTSKLADVEWYDVSDQVQYVQIRRGRSRQLDYFQGGAATVTLRNASRDFDPLNTASPYYGGIEPRCLIRISSRDKWLFTGFVNDWDLEYDIANQDTAIAYCSDAFAILANQLLSVSTPLSELPGARINRVLSLSEVNYRGGRRIATGHSTLGAYQIPNGTNALNYLRQVERTEFGYLYVASNGDIVFRERGEIPANEVLTFNDDGSGLPYQTLDNQFGDELLYNYVRVTSPASEEIVSDEVSVTRYQISQLFWDDLLGSDIDENLGLAEVLLGRYSVPLLRLTGFTIQIAALTDDQKDQVFTADLTDYLYVEKSFAAGTPSSHSQLSVLTGISHEIRPGNHRVGFTVENADTSVFLILGDSFAGQLDLGVLDF